MSCRVFAMHQPNYIPYLGYFHKMAHCDVFVYLDSVQYPKGGFAARNRIKGPSGAQYLTIPIRIPKGRHGKVSYPEVEYADSRWRKKHLGTIRANYARAPFFSEIFPMFEKIIWKEQSFVDKNIHLSEAIANYLCIGSERVRLSEILESFGRKTQLICDVAARLRAFTYLSGTGGGKDYNDPEMMARHGVELVYDEFLHPEYPQLHGAFVSHLSILDVLFNVGARARAFLQREVNGHL